MKNCWNVRSASFYAVIFFSSSLSAQAQFSEPELNLVNDEKYIYPVRPGQPGSLAGNLGELRSTHFHSGIDIRTDNKAGYPIHASKSGYISRVSVSPTGYGNVLYITHPDGNTTLYAHLEQFNGPVREYVLNEQYNRKTFDIDLFFPENQFVVKQGDTIGFSGNTGSSGGPHLHFDIRDPNNVALDPLQFGFSEIVDKNPPYVEKVALVTLDAQSRINDKFGRFEFHAYRSGNNYTISSPILAYGNIGVEILAKDRFSASSRFYGGVKFIDMHLDNELIFSQSIDKVNVSEPRDIFTLMNFKTFRSQGSRFYKLYLDDGNKLPYYKPLSSTGKIQVSSDKTSDVQVTLRDAHGNASSMTFRLKPSAPAKEVHHLEAPKSDVMMDITENVMMISSKSCPAFENKAYLYKDGISTLAEADYYNTHQAVYLIDLRKTVPDSIFVCGVTLHPEIKTVIPSGVEYNYYGEWVDIEFPATALYDTLYFNLSRSRDVVIGEEVFTIGQNTVPLNNTILVSLKPDEKYLNNKKLSVYRRNRKSYTYLGGEWVNERIQFRTREFGEFTLLEDSVPPTIRPVYIDKAGARFRIKDDLSGISSYKATLNGEWVLMHYDSKSGSLWSQMRHKSQLMRGNFELEVTDNAGNKQVYQHTIP